MPQLPDPVLREPAAAKLADAIEGIAAVPIRGIDASLPGALAGERGQAREYVNAYKQLAGAVLEKIGFSPPRLLIVDELHHAYVGLPKNEPATTERVNKHRAKRDSRPEPVSREWMTAMLTDEAMSAPFGEWVGTFGAGKGTAVALIERLRQRLPEAAPLRAPREVRLPEWALDERSVIAFHRAVLDELAGKCSPLEQVASAFDLSQTELARLFGVRRQAVEQWQRRGVPAERQEKLATLGEIADLLAAKLKPERIPGVVRRPGDAYGGRSILQAIADGDQDFVLEELRDAFDWATAA